METYLDRLAEELGAPGDLSQLEAVDDHLRAALTAIDGLAGRVMRILLDRELGDDDAIPTATRKVFSATVLAYRDSLAVLEERARDTASRVNPGSGAALAARVISAAVTTLELHRRLRAAVLTLACDHAAAALALVRQAACDRSSEDATRRHWSAARRDLESIIAQPERVAQLRRRDRLAAFPALLDEPEPQRELTFAELIEMD